jgi:hypothetical protein
MGNNSDISDILHEMNLKRLFFEIGCKGTPKNGLFFILHKKRLNQSSLQEDVGKNGIMNYEVEIFSSNNITFHWITGLS